MDEYIGTVIFAAMVITPITLIALDIVFFVKKKERPIFELIAFFIGFIYMALAYMLWDLPDYQYPLNIREAGAHAPFSGEHIGAIILFMLVGFFSYFLLKFVRKSIPPLVEVLLLGGVYAGCIINTIWMFQLVCGANPEQMHLGISDYEIIICLCLVPILFFIHVAQMLVVIVKEKAQKQEDIHYQNAFLQKMNCWLLRSANLFWVSLIALLPVLGILVILLCLFGQQPDSIILAFTKTSDWILSQEISPPPIEKDAHYLCTVSLRGHRRLVKPLRYGIRKGTRIVVNRQLCVANAFEQLLMEKTPRFHHLVRNFYDTYGYPVSKLIRHAWSADLVYLIMKPLEWIFVVVLYLFDLKPENRIASQYLPQISKESIMSSSLN